MKDGFESRRTYHFRCFFRIFIFFRRPYKSVFHLFSNIKPLLEFDSRFFRLLYCEAFTAHSSAWLDAVHGVWYVIMLTGLAYFIFYLFIANAQ